MTTNSMPTRPPHIAHVLHRLHVAGAEVLAADLSRRLRDRFGFIFLCLDGVGPLGETLRGEGFTVIDLGRKPGVDWSVGRRMKQAIAEHHIGLLHAHQYTPFFYAALGRRLSARPPILFTEHGRHYPDSRSTKRVIANKFLLRRLDRVTAVGEFVRQALVNNEGLPAHRIEVIRNGIDPDRFTAPADPSLRAAMRGELSLRDHELAILQVARFHPVKDHDTAVRALASLVHGRDGCIATPSAVLLLAGDGDRRAAIEALARELGVAERVRFLGVRNDVPRLMAAADAFQLSSVSEGISVTLLEAMGCGLPIAATEVGGNGEVVAHGVTGLLSPRADHAALARNLATLLANPTQRHAFGAAGRVRLLQLFTQSQMHAGYADLYQQMTASL